LGIPELDPYSLANSFIDKIISRNLFDVTHVTHSQPEVHMIVAQVFTTFDCLQHR